MKFSCSHKEANESRILPASLALRQFFVGLLFLFTLFVTPFEMKAWAIQNTATGTMGGSNLDLSNASVILNLIANNAPVGGYIADDIIPQAQISQATDGSGMITINWKGRDAESNNVTLKNFQYSDDGGITWYTPDNGDTSAALSANWNDNGGGGWTTDITLAAAPAHSFTFNTKHADVTAVQALDGVDQSDIQIRFVLNDGTVDSVNPVTSESFRVDNFGPTNTFVSGTYDATTDTLIFRGSGFTTIAPAGADITTYVDWAKLQWDINGDDMATANIGFVIGDVTSFTVTDDMTLTLVFTGAKGTAIESTAGYANAGGTDTLDIQAGFTVDAFGNAALTDAVSDGPLLIYAPGITISESGGTTDVAEGANTDSYTLVLDSPPANTVDVTVSPDAQTDVGAGAGVPVILSFTTVNWNIPQTVTVAANDDVIVEGLHTSTILHTTASTDPGYNGIAINSVTANITDNDNLPLLFSAVVADPQIVIANGVDTASLITTLIDENGLPVTGKTINYSSDRGIADTITQPAGVTDANGVAIGTVASTAIGEAVISATNITDSFTLLTQPRVYFTQGMVLELSKAANKEEAPVGDIITYEIVVSNQTLNDVVQVKVNDIIPPDFKYLKGSTQINGSAAPDPAGNRTLLFDMGTLPAFVDSNGNGRVDSGEPGYISITYKLIVGSGAVPGKYTNKAYATDACSLCYISNESSAEIEVIYDPLFDLGTIIGKVFEDTNGDGLQSEGESGVAGAMVVLDNGTYVLTDEHGRYHFPAVKPGQRLVKLNLDKLAPGAAAVNGEIKILTVTEGLLARANFGVNYEQGLVTIGFDGEPGIAVTGKTSEEPVQLAGNVEAMKLFINGQPASLRLSDVKMGLEKIEEIVHINGNQLDGVIEFKTDVIMPDNIEEWLLAILDSSGKRIHAISGKGAPPQVVRWNGRVEGTNILEGGEIYQYRLEVTYKDKSASISAKRIFGVNRTSAISLNMSGGAFRLGSFELTSEAMDVLKETATVLRKYPEEKIIIEGHSDSTGSKAINLSLSRKRAEAARDYLVKKEGLPAKRFIVRWYGESRPIASNDTEEGRVLNRRVEINGEFSEVELAKIYDQFRTRSMISINGKNVYMRRSGHFSTEIEGDAAIGGIEIKAVNRRGQSVHTRIPAPVLEITHPDAEEVLPYGRKEGRYLVYLSEGEDMVSGDQGALLYELVGKTDPQNSLELDGKPVNVAHDGSFSITLELNLGENKFNLLITSRAGFTRITNLHVNVRNRDEKGRLLMLIDPVPYLTVNFPPEGRAIHSELLTLSGTTSSDNLLQINGKPVQINVGGKFSETLKLPVGKHMIRIDVVDSEGYRGVIEREVEVTDRELFFLAFADGKISQLKGKGYLEGAGMDKSTEYRKEGRLAFYLKGVIAGKYLITSAFDTGKKEFSQLFDNLDETENDKFFTNLDPDKLYPVYGDSSTPVYDAQSQGKFYLAIESDEFNLLAGNFPVKLNDTELAAYRRTLYGGKVSYQSSSRTRYGQPDTKIILFGAEVKEAHYSDELRATGGSLYYLSHDDVIEGSEQITLTIRDKNTGLVLVRSTKERNVDYSIKYSEGRILFNHPVSSFSEDDRLTDEHLLAGNPVYIEVDYESRLDSFEKTASGVYARQQIGDYVAVGATHVKDELSTGAYELEGVDAEIRLGKNTRLIGEVAESSGVASLKYLSEDGGLSYNDSTPGGNQEGKAWKVAAELDIGEWFNDPGKIRLGGYLKEVEPGFLSSGNFLEKGTRKLGYNSSLKVTDYDTLLARYDHEALINETTALPETLNETMSTTIQWTHLRKGWSLAAEYFARESRDEAGGLLEESSYGVARFDAHLTEKLKATLEHQATLSGMDNDQTTLGADYKINETLSLGASGTQGTRGRAAEGEMRVSLNGGNIYLTERMAEDEAGHRSAAILGAESDVGESAKVYTEYQWIYADSGKQNISLVGARRDWMLSKGFRLAMSAEHSEIDADPQKSKRLSVSAGLYYSNTKGFKASTRNELRDEKGDERQVQYLTSNNIEVKLDADFTSLAHYRYSVTKDLDSHEKLAEFRETGAGLAYRPVAHDWLNALAKYTRLSEMRPLNVGGLLSTVTESDVASLEWSMELNRYVEWVGKEAAKIKTEKTGEGSELESRTYLTIQRLNFHMTPRIDLGAEYRILKQIEADDEREGWLAELAWKAAKHLRLGVGYNFTDFSDNEFSDNNYSVEGGFVRLQSMF